MSEFKSFSEIKRYKGGIYCIITEKIHGSNGQLLIQENEILAGSRTRWLSPGKETDNYGFAAWVEENKLELIEKLGPGRYFGEWYGSGINHSYGLKEKRLALFNTKAFPKERPLPSRVDVVPVLYQGIFSDEIVKKCLFDLMSSGSALVYGCMKPEGIVIHFPEFGHSYKAVFEAEETGWTGKLGDKVKREQIDVSAYLQPIRLEKLLSRDSRYVEGFPENLPEITRAYLEDMEKEHQFDGVDEPIVKATKKKLYNFIKEVIDRK